MDPAMFVVDRGVPTAPAKAVCNAPCPVKDECLEFAVANGETGVWGGEVLTFRKPYVITTPVVETIAAPRRRRGKSGT